MKFPRLKRNQDKRFKLSEQDIKDMVEFKKSNTWKATSEEFGVSTSTILYYINPDYRKRQMAKNAKHVQSSPNYNKNCRRQRRDKGEAFALYHRVTTKERRDRKKEN